ncbi:MAG: hypothetical protein IJM63_05165 [Solobacterium sp.]|nr:hypothetical protein [Solobacterium sp.]
MKYPNAYNGIKKIHTAELLSLLAGILGTVAVAFGGLASQQIAQGGADSLTPAAAFGTMIPLFGAGIIGIVASLMQFLGLKDAAADEENFKKGFTYALAGLIIAVVLSILSMMNLSNSMIDDFGKIISNFVQIVVTLYVINGIRSLAEKLGESGIEGRGKKVFNIYAASVILASVVELLMTVLSGSARTIVVGILGALMLVLTVVGYIMYLRYLSAAKKMLA